MGLGVWHSDLKCQTQAGPALAASGEQPQGWAPGPAVLGRQSLGLDNPACHPGVNLPPAPQESVLPDAGSAPALLSWLFGEKLGV